MEEVTAIDEQLALDLIEEEYKEASDDSKA